MNGEMVGFATDSEGLIIYIISGCFNFCRYIFIGIKGFKYAFFLRPKLYKCFGALRLIYDRTKRLSLLFG